MIDHDVVLQSPKIFKLQPKPLYLKDHMGLYSTIKNPIPRWVLTLNNKICDKLEFSLLYGLLQKRKALHAFYSKFCNNSKVLDQ